MDMFWSYIYHLNSVSLRDKFDLLHPLFFSTMWEVTTHNSDINNNMFPIFNINGIKMVRL